MITYAGYSFNVDRWPKPNTIPKIKWHVKAGGNYSGVDYGSTFDKFLTSISITAKYSIINDLYNTLKSNQNTETVSLGSGDERFIFGADVLCTAATFLEVEKPENLSFNVYRMGMSLEAVTFSFTGTASQAGLIIGNGWAYGSTFEINKHRSYNGSYVYTEKNHDIATYEGVFTLDTDTMQSFRRYLLTTVRATTVSFASIPGETYPFGVDKGTGPFNVKVIEWEDLGKRDFKTWNLRLVLALVQ